LNAAAHMPSATPGRVAIVGGGIVGITTALGFRRNGHDVVVIDPALAELRCSFGNAGSLSAGSVAPLAMPGMLAKVPGMLFGTRAPLRIAPRYSIRAVPWLTRFFLASSRRRVEQISLALNSLLSDSIDLHSKLLKQLNALDLIQRRGQLQLYPSPAALAADNNVWELRRRRGVVAEKISRDEIRQLEPAIGERYTCGVYLPNEALVTNPARLIDVLTKHFVGLGGTLVKARVTGFEHDGSVAKGVSSDVGPVPASAIVIAAGAWSNELSRLAGDDVPLQTQRGYHITLPNAGITLTRPVVAADRKYFASPLEMGIRVAGTVEFDAIDAPPDPRRTQMLASTVPQLLPGIKVANAGTWMGHRPCMPDSLPVIDRASKLKNVFYGFGNGHLGLTAAPKMAELLFELVTDRAPRIDLQPFRATRFKGLKT
jgi:glycine/D-amino acid oxidase-like deaminating enzyme